MADGLLGVVVEVSDQLALQAHAGVYGLVVEINDQQNFSSGLGNRGIIVETIPHYDNTVINEGNYHI